MRTLANSKDPDDNAAFHHGLHYNDFQRKAIQLLYGRYNMLPLNRYNGSSSVHRRMAENGFAPPPPLGNFADISYLVEN